MAALNAVPHQQQQSFQRHILVAVEDAEVKLVAASSSHLKSAGQRFDPRPVV